MAGGGVVRLLLLGVLFHALCIFSIFDIYFQSPVESSIPSANYTSSPPARRVIVFTVDGCRVDKLYKATAGYTDRFNRDPDSATTAKDLPSGRAPFLGDVMRRRGSWGVSHNHVPTESRPCHVALTAGMYEDPHAVTKNWKQHPVPFDSVFNQSNNAFIFGNRDVAPMLARHAPHAQEEHYSAREENEMAREDPSLLDVWSFRKMKALFAQGTEKRDAELHAQLNQDKLVIYCHFLGTDLSGPKYGAHSREYLENIAVVDELVEKTEKMVETYFGHDGRTAYVLNSDHGMDARGNHGDDDPAKSRTAIVAWGAGIQGAIAVNVTDGKRFDIDLPTQSRAEVQKRLEAQEREEQVAEREWATLIRFERKDVMQTDVAPLISALAGLPYPRNSVGVLPFTYLTKNKYRANAVRANAQQLYQHAMRKEEIKRAHRGWLFVPYTPLRSRALELAGKIDDALRDISDNGNEPRHDEAHRLVETLSQEMINICRIAIVYYQKYDWMFLFGSIILGYIGLALVMVVAYINPVRFRLRWLLTQTIDFKTAVTVAAIVWWRFLADSPISYYLYGVCPVIFWSFTWNHLDQLRAAMAPRQRTTMVTSWRGRFHITWIFFCLQLVVQGYTWRPIFSVLFGGLVFWPRIFADSSMVSGESKNSRILLSPSMCWSVGCLLVAIFPCLPVEYGTNTPLVHLGALLTMVFAFTVLRNVIAKNDSKEQLKKVLGVGVPPILLALLTLQSTVWIIERRATPPFSLVMANWALAITPPLSLLARIICLSNVEGQLPIRSGTKGDIECQQRATHGNPSVQVVRLVQVLLAFAPSFALLSTAYEMLFYLALCTMLVSWLLLEAEYVFSSIPVVERETHRALIFLLLVQISFFGTSSVTSMTDFRISSATRFLTSSSAFIAQALVVLKLLVPFIVVACTFRLILLLPSRVEGSSIWEKKDMKCDRHLPMSRYFLLAAVMADVLAVRFLFLVNNEGSWKQMGNSIAVFCIGNAQIVLLPTVALLAWFFIHDLEPRDEYEPVDTRESDKAC